ncbi:MAG TPA: hypothetical protein VLE69_00960 [Candidatus Saccharimonadales bacterium]|nr:hypothetical protein [Candidatus Saccharimonadales bacterium]
MRRFIVTMLFLGSVGFGVLGIPSAASAGTTVFNYGQCHVQNASDSASAPGQTGTGPMTLAATGSTQTPNAFNSWTMCFKG